MKAGNWWCVDKRRVSISQTKKSLSSGIARRSGWGGVGDRKLRMGRLLVSIFFQNRKLRNLTSETNCSFQVFLLTSLILLHICLHLLFTFVLSGSVCHLLPLRCPPAAPSAESVYYHGPSSGITLLFDTQITKPSILPWNCRLARLLSDFSKY